LSTLAETVDPDGRVVVLDAEGWEHILHEHEELILALAAGCSWSYISTRHQHES
jgi:hypothetical protein